MVLFFTKCVALAGAALASELLETDIDSLQLLQAATHKHVMTQTAQPRPFEGKGRRIPSHPRAQEPENAKGDTKDALADVDQSKYDDLVFTNVVHNNLGNMGPDFGKPEGIRFGNAATVDGASVDVLLTADGYKTTQTGRNGLSGAVGIVNMVNNNGAEFKFKFLKAGTDEPQRMGGFILSFLDLDKGMKGGREKLTIQGYKHYTALEASEVIIDAGAGTFSASTRGTKADNPDDPHMLTDEAARRTISFEFPEGLSEVPFRYEVEENFNKEEEEGREFMFAGMNSVYFCKTKKVSLDFSLAGVIYSNLGKLGPDFDKPEGLRYGKVATFADGRQLDMIINALSPYEVKNNLANGLSGKFGQVSMMSATETKFKFTFVVPGTDDVAAVDWMYFSIFDLDEGKRGRNRETLIIQDVTTHFMTERSLVTVADLGGGKFSYSSSRKGTGKDNPKDPMTMTQRQKDMSVSFLFHNKTGFEATFKVGAKYGFTRNFNFAGQSNAIFC